MDATARSQLKPAGVRFSVHHESVAFAQQNEMQFTLVLRFAYRNLLRHPVRTWLTISGIAIAILAFATLRTLVDSWYARVDAASATRLVTRNAISLAYRLPVTYKARIRQIRGVTSVSYGNWFGGVYVNEKNVFPQFAIDVETYLGLYPEYVLSPQEMSAFLRDRNGAIAGRELADKYGWKVGDVISLIGTRYPGTLRFVLRGIYRGAEDDTDERVFFFHWNVLNERLRENRSEQAEQVGAFVVGIQQASRAAEISREVDQAFANSLAETRTETQKAFQLGFISMSQTIVTGIQAFGFIIIIIMMTVVSNAMALSVRERVREYATLKALGFGPGHLFSLIFGEAVAIAVAGGGMGVFAAFPAMHGIRAALNGTFPLSNVSQPTILVAMAMALLIGVVAAAAPAWHVARISVTQGLRSTG
jgi:putative ABC transport system permease protein